MSIFELKRAEYKDLVVALRNLADDLEAGRENAHTAVVVTLGEGEEIGIYSQGDRTDVMSALGLLTAGAFALNRIASGD